MITAVLDTNVLASGFVQRHPSSPPAQLVEAWRASLYTLIISEHIIAELNRTFLQPYFRQQITPQQATRLSATLRGRALLTDITVAVRGVATHQEDDLTLSTAVSAGAHYLVTGDKKLQHIGTNQGVRIVSPREFLEILTSPPHEDQDHE